MLAGQYVLLPRPFGRVLSDFLTDLVTLETSPLWGSLLQQTQTITAAMVAVTQTLQSPPTRG